MHFVNIVKWLITVIMGITLLLCAVPFIGDSFVKQHMPTIDQLTPLRVTVKEAVLGSDVQSIVAANYQLQIELNGHLPQSVVAAQAIKPGEEVTAYVATEQAHSLEQKDGNAPKFMIGYGLVLSNGSMVVDPHYTLSGAPQRVGNSNALKISILPVLWFAFLSIMFINRRRRFRANAAQQ